MNVYGLLMKLVDGSTLGETDKQAGREVIEGLNAINAFGSAARMIESETQEQTHTHIIETKWDDLNVGKIKDVCTVCHVTIKGPYDPKVTNTGYRGSSYYGRTW